MAEKGRRGGARINKGLGTTYDEDDAAPARQENFRDKGSSPRRGQRHDVHQRRRRAAAACSCARRRAFARSVGRRRAAGAGAGTEAGAATATGAGAGAWSGDGVCVFFSGVGRTAPRAASAAASNARDTSSSVSGGTWTRARASLRVFRESCRVMKGTRCDGRVGRRQLGPAALEGRGRRGGEALW